MDKKIEEEINAYIKQYKQFVQKSDEMINFLSKQGYDINQVFKFAKRISKKESYKAVKELYEIIKTEKGQDVLGDVLVNWQSADWFQREFHLILLGYKVLLLTKDISAVYKAVASVSNDDGVKCQYIEGDVMRIARAEGIEYVGKKTYENYMPSEEEIFSRRIEKIEKNKQQREK